MANHVTTADLETGVFDLTNALSESEWDDAVKDSYYRFLAEEKQLISGMKWMTDKANDAYTHVTGVDVGKFHSTYSECVSKLTRLQRGD